MPAAGSIADLLDALGDKLEAHRFECVQTRAINAPDFNPYLYAHFNEVGLSTVLGDLLNPSGTHGQGHAFLARFLEIAGLPDLAGGCEYANVRLEHGTYTLEEATRRRIDLVIQGSTWIVGIENKPWAEDQQQQVADYLRHLREVGHARSHLLYLTSDGRRPQPHSIDEASCTQAQGTHELLLMSYVQIADWLEACIGCCRADGVKWFLTYFRAHVNRILLGKIPDEVTEMILQTVFEPAHLPAAMRLLQSGDAIRKELKSRLMKAIESQLPKGWKICRSLVDHDWLGIRIPGIAGGYFGVELEGGRCFYGMKRDEETSPAEQARLEAFCAKLQARAPNLEKLTRWWPYWRWFDGHRENAPREYANWDSSTQPWVDMSNGKMAERIVALARELHALGTAP